MKKLFLSLLTAMMLGNYLLAQSIAGPTKIVAELHPARTIRVAFHVIHRYSIDDTFNIPNDSLAAVWWQDRLDSINHYLENPAKPNYTYYKDYARDSKIRVRSIGVFHHVDSVYWKNAGIGEFYDRFVRNNAEFGTFEKDSVLHSFYYGDDKWGGMAGGIPSRVGMRFKGRWRGFWHYRNVTYIS